MALFVNARTYQVLYVIRQLARADKDATVAAIGDFIADRRKAAPDTYSNAYISPGNLVEMCQRLTQEGLLTPGPAFELTPQGSLMADVINDVDACTSTFIEGYKGIVVEEALRQRARVGLGPATQQDLAQATGFSVDSVRRGISELGVAVVTTSSGRVQNYVLASPPPVQPADGGLLDDFDDAPIPVVSDPPSVDPTGDVQTPVVPQAPEPSQDVDLGKLLESVDEPDLPPAPVPLPMTTAVPSDTTATTDIWDSVPEELREALILKAQALRMSFLDYLTAIEQDHTTKMRVALFGTALSRSN